MFSFRGLRRNVGNLWKSRLLHWTNSGHKKNNFSKLIFLREFARFSVGGQSYCHFLTTGSAENEVWMNRFWKWGPICSEFCPLCSWDKTWTKKYCVKEFFCRLLDSIVLGPFSTSIHSANNLRRLVRVLRHRSEFCPLRVLIPNFALVSLKTRVLPHACLIVNEILQGYTRRVVQQMWEESAETIDGYGIYR